MTVRVKLFAVFRERANTKEASIEAASVREALAILVKRYPALSPLIFEGDSVRAFVHIFLNGKTIKEYRGLDTELHEGDELAIFPPVSGGLFRQVTQVEEALSIFLGVVTQIRDAEAVTLEQCCGRVLAENIVSMRDVPNYTRAAMDGYAVRSQDTGGAAPSSPVVLAVGSEVAAGVCMRVHTGSPVPAGFDAVVMLEDTRTRGSMVEVFAVVAPFENLGERGEDIKSGETVLRKGHLLRGCDAAVLAALGIGNVKVMRRPVAVIIPTGDELVPPGQEPREGEAIETNRLMAGMYIGQWGGIPVKSGIIRDDPALLKRAIASHQDADMILICGGSSVGARDHAPAVVSSLGSLLVHGVAMSPGKPTGLGAVGGKPVICLPGYPVACFAALFTFALPALRKLSGRELPLFTRRARLGEKIASRTGYRTYVRVTLKDGLAYPLMSSGAGIMSSLSRADGMVVVPEDVEGYSEGDEVEVIIIN
ncbi:MAG TPA: MoaD family protein [Candidatus Methanoperedenaceae archaeon]|nr:MoaD family protein [Candidatus Methanoperedenaceae archaeon]